MQDMKEVIKTHMIEAAGNVIYTYNAHWNIVNRLKKQNKTIKVVQIILTALSTSGFLGAIFSGISQLSWVGGLTSAIALGLNLYTLNFNIEDDICKHTDAANALWEVREAYKAAITDIELLSIEEARSRRDEMTKIVSHINKSYPGTDEKSFSKAQKEMDKYQFKPGEAESLLVIERGK